MLIHRPLRNSPTPPNSPLLCRLLLTADTKEEAKAVDDGALTPVPEVVGVAGVPKATQTQAPPTSPPPSAREKARCACDVREGVQVLFTVEVIFIY